MRHGYTRTLPQDLQCGGSAVNNGGGQCIAIGTTLQINLTTPSSPALYPLRSVELAVPTKGVASDLPQAHPCHLYMHNTPSAPQPTQPSQQKGQSQASQHASSTVDSSTTPSLNVEAAPFVPGAPTIQAHTSPSTPTHSRRWPQHKPTRAIKNPPRQAHQWLEQPACGCVPTGPQWAPRG